MMHLETFAREMMDESSLLRVDIRRNKVKSSRKHISFQATLFLHPVHIRAEELGVTLEEATNLVEEKLRKQIERYKMKLHRRGMSGEWIPESTLEQLSNAQNDLQHTLPVIGKRKKISGVQTLHEQEAIEQLELVSHDFYIFDSKDSGHPSVVYRRRDGSYGVIELDR